MAEEILYRIRITWQLNRGKTSIAYDWVCESGGSELTEGALMSTVIAGNKWRRLYFDTKRKIPVIVKLKNLDVRVDYFFDEQIDALLFMRELLLEYVGKYKADRLTVKSYVRRIGGLPADVLKSYRGNKKDGAFSSAVMAFDNLFAEIKKEKKFEDKEIDSDVVRKFDFNLLERVWGADGIRKIFKDFDTVRVRAFEEKGKRPESWEDIQLLYAGYRKDFEDGK